MDIDRVNVAAWLGSNRFQDRQQFVAEREGFVDLRRWVENGVEALVARNRVGAPLNIDEIFAVAAGAAVDRVLSVATAERVKASLAENRVIAVSAEQTVREIGTSSQRVVSIAGINHDAGQSGVVRSQHAPQVDGVYIVVAGDHDRLNHAGVDHS